MRLTAGISDRRLPTMRRCACRQLVTAGLELQPGCRFRQPSGQNGGSSLLCDPRCARSVSKPANRKGGRPACCAVLSPAGPRGSTPVCTMTLGNPPPLAGNCLPEAEPEGPQPRIRLSRVSNARGEGPFKRLGRCAE